MVAASCAAPRRSSALRAMAAELGAKLVVCSSVRPWK